MIVTLTPNPSLDRTIEIPELRRGEVHRATGGRVDPGGKGVNVSRALAAGDTATVAVLPSGGPEGAQLAALLEPFGVQTVQVPITGTVRSNITVAEPDGTTTKLNEAGPELSPDEAAAVEAGPDLIKPNAEELAELVGRPLHRLADVVDAAAEVRKRGVGTVLVSLGGGGAPPVGPGGGGHGGGPPPRGR